MKNIMSLLVVSILSISCANNQVIQNTNDIQENNIKKANEQNNSVISKEDNKINSSISSQNTNNTQSNTNINYQKEIENYIKANYHESTNINDKEIVIYTQDKIALPYDADTINLKKNDSIEIFPVIVNRNNKEYIFKPVELYASDGIKIQDNKIITGDKTGIYDISASYIVSKIVTPDTEADIERERSTFNGKGTETKYYRVEFKVNVIDNLNYNQISNKSCVIDIKNNNRSKYEYTLQDSEVGKLEGIVYDLNNKPIVGAKVQLVNSKRELSLNCELNEYYITDAYGYYSINSVPLYKTSDLVVSKEDYGTVRSIALLRDNYRDKVRGITTKYAPINFESIYALQNEPYIEQININAKKVVGATNGDVFLTSANLPKVKKYSNIEQFSDKLNKDYIIYNPNLTGIDSNKIKIEMTFSEPVIKENVEKNLRIISKKENEELNIITTKTPDTSFSWKDNKTFIFEINKKVNSNKLGTDELRYAIEFIEPFTDLNNNSALQYRYFRLSPSQVNDFIMFSVANTNK